LFVSSSRIGWQLATIEILVRNDQVKAEKQTGSVRFVSTVAVTTSSLIAEYDDNPALISLPARVPRYSPPWSIIMPIRVTLCLSKCFFRRRMQAVNLIPPLN